MTAAIRSEVSGIEGLGAGIAKEVTGDIGARAVLGEDDDDGVPSPEGGLADVEIVRPPPAQGPLDAV